MEAAKLIDDIVLLEERSVSIGISIQALKKANEEEPEQSIYSPTSLVYNATSPFYSPVRSQDSDDEPKVCC